MITSFLRNTFITVSLSTISLCSLAAHHGDAPHPDATHKGANKGVSLDAALAAQVEENKARYGERHPKETLNFFQIKPGMTVVEALPGGGWYTKILLPYLGSDGQLVGADYAQEMWPNFSFATPEFIEEKKTWVNTWSEEASQWHGEHGANVSAFQFNALPENMHGSADAVLFIRALHNLARFEDKGAYLSKAMQETYSVLKPGGIVGVVQHKALEDRPDEWANGSNGYLKQSFVIETFEKHGFEFVGATNINENPDDQATTGDIVWRLPPRLAGSDDDSEKRANMIAIGESNRMTLTFKKPETAR